MLSLILAVLLGIALVLLLRYVLAIRHLSRQIVTKLATGSHGRLTSSFHSRSVVDLTDQVGELFAEVEKAELVAMREKKTFDMAISNIAHDIRTPLTVASGYTQQLLTKDDMDKDLLLKVSDNLDVVSKRLEALLEYRRLQEGALRPQLEEVGISQLTVQSVLPYYDAFQEAGIQLDLQVEEGLVYTTDGAMLERLLQNLISNILKHGKEEAVIGLKQQEDHLVLTVTNKVQQPIQHLDRLTSRFYSENLSNTEESSGLGLYISQEIAQLLGGTFDMRADGDWFSVEVRL